MEQVKVSYKFKVGNFFVKKFIEGHSIELISDDSNAYTFSEYSTDDIRLPQNTTAENVNKQTRLNVADFQRKLFIDGFDAKVIQYKEVITKQFSEVEWKVDNRGREDFQ